MPLERSHDAHAAVREAAIEIAWGLVLWAGFAATLAVSWFAAVARWIGLTRLEPARLLGCVVLARPDAALTRVTGTALYLLLGIVVLPAAYAWAFESLHRADAVIGLALGVVQAALAGVGIAAAGRWSRCARFARADPPGLFGWRAGSYTAPAVIVAHLFYGALLGFVYVAPGA